MSSIAGTLAAQFRAALRDGSQCPATGRPCPITGDRCDLITHTGPMVYRMAEAAEAVENDLPPEVADLIGYPGQQIKCYLYQDGSVLAYTKDIGCGRPRAWVIRSKLEKAVISKVFRRVGWDMDIQFKAIIAELKESPKTRGGDRGTTIETAILGGTMPKPLNGIRDDNRIENLELWIKPPRPGIRARDALAWARKIVADYGDMEL